MIGLKRLNIEEIRELFNDYYFKKGMEANINHILFDMNYEYKFELNVDSEHSYSTDNFIYVGLPKECIGMTQEKIYAIVKALVGHESSHIKWSNFKERAKAIEAYQEKGGNWLLYSALSNILEDGRVERLLCEQLRGFRKYIKFANKVLIVKSDNASLVDEDILINLIRTIHYLAVIGKYPSNYKRLFSHSQRQLIEEEIAPRVLDSVNSDSYKTALDMTEEIINIMDSMIDKVLDEKETNFLKQLSRQTYNSSNGRDSKKKKNSLNSPNPKDNKDKELDSQQNNKDQGSNENRNSDFKEDNSNNEGNQSKDNQSTGNGSENNNDTGDSSKNNGEAGNNSGKSNKLDTSENKSNSGDNTDSSNDTPNKGDKLDKGNKAGKDSKEDASNEGNTNKKDDLRGTNSNDANGDDEKSTEGNSSDSSDSKGSSSNVSSTGTKSKNTEAKYGYSDKNSSSKANSEPQSNERASNKDLSQNSQGTGNADNAVDNNKGLDNNSSNKASENGTNQSEGNSSSTKSDKSSSMNNGSQKQSANSIQQPNNIPVNHIGSEDYDKSFSDSDILDRKMFRDLERLIDRESKTALNAIKLRADKEAREQEELAELKGPIDYHSEIDLDSINSHYNSRTKEPNFKYEYPNAPYEVAPAEFNMDIRILENEFKKLLNYRQTTARNQKKGRLDSNKLWKLSMHDGNVFYKENNNKNGGCAVYILIDLSGSTEGVKYKLEMATATCIEGALMNIPDVEVKTVGFSHFYNDSMSHYRASGGLRNRYMRDETGYSCMRVFKDFKEKRSKTPYAYRNSFAGGDNRDGFAIRVALDELSKHSAKNKLLLILSDGMPAWRGESREEAMTDVKNAVHEGRKSTTIMSVLLNEGEIDEQTKNCFDYMYEDRGNIMVDVTKEPENIMKYLSLYLRRVLKRR